MCPSRTGMLAWLRTAGAIVVIIGLYFVAPMPWARSEADQPGLRAAVCLAGLVVLTWLLTRQVRRALQPERLFAERLEVLLIIVSLVVVFFAATYFLIADQFAGLRTRLDALYFSVTTLGTLGYGDIVPIGQGARVAVMVQVVFDLIIVTSALTIVVGGMRRPGKS
ncbi:potassium channel family protein [Nonomuraea rosea]|uniref:Potassium channel family protein n=2 Tax=Nonomuraea rosea TaxID=638574 RepID=A0ABP6Z8R5_9ACTN